LALINSNIEENIKKMAKVIKAILDNGEVLEVENYKTYQEIKEQEPTIVSRIYYKQFRDIDNDLVNCIEDDVIKDYAEWHLDMKDEDDFEDKTLCDFDDEEIESHCIAYKIYPCPLNNPIAQGIYDNMLKLFDKYSLPELSEKIENLLR